MRRIFLIVIAIYLLTLLAGCRALPAVVPATQPVVETPTTQPVTPIPPTSTPTPTNTPTSMDIPCRASKGSIVDVEIPTDQINRPVNTKIYLPPCYDGDPLAGYPVLYMLHGQAAMNDQWVRLGLTGAADELINQGKIRPFIIVMPFEITWTPGPEESKFDEALITDVIPYIDTHYATCIERGCRAVGGLSRGGNWAVYLGFAYPELFSTVGAHSTPLFYGEVARISQALDEAAMVDDLPYVLMDMGSKDDDRANVQAFRTFLETKGILFDYHQFEGRHEESYWAAHVADYLKWYSDRFITPGDD